MELDPIILLAGSYSASLSAAGMAHLSAGMVRSNTLTANHREDIAP